jgi:hypothetical protein
MLVPRSHRRRACRMEAILRSSLEKMTFVTTNNLKALDLHVGLLQRIVPFEKGRSHYDCIFREQVLAMLLRFFQDYTVNSELHSKISGVDYLQTYSVYFFFQHSSFIGI